MPSVDFFFFWAIFLLDLDWSLHILACLWHYRKDQDVTKHSHSLHIEHNIHSRFDLNLAINVGLNRRSRGHQIHYVSQKKIHVAVCSVVI